MGKKKDVKIILDTYGNYLGMEKGCIVLRDKKKNETRYPIVENLVSDVVLNSGNMISTGLLCYMGFWGIDVLVSTRYGRPVAVLKNLDDDLHVDTRVSQYRGLKNGKGCHMARAFVAGKIMGQNKLLAKYGLETDESYVDKIYKEREHRLSLLRRRLLGLEGKFGRFYFKQVFRLFPEEIRPHYRSSYRAYDGVNNIFNLAYKILFWKCYKALLQAHLEPYLGYLHKMEFGRPSMVCDCMELYRHLIDGFLIEYCKDLKPTDFKGKNEKLGKRKVGKRMYLKDSITKGMVGKLFEYFQTKVYIPRVKRGLRQEIETLIDEEAFLMARYLRMKGESWVPRIANP